MPLSGVKYTIRAQDSVLKSKLHMTYVNDSDIKIEAVLELPNNTDLVISRVQVKVGNKEVLAQVQEKKKAKERYDDAIAAGD